MGGRRERTGGGDECLGRKRRNMKRMRRGGKMREKGRGRVRREVESEEGREVDRERGVEVVGAMRRLRAVWECIASVGRSGRG